MDFDKLSPQLVQELEEKLRQKGRRLECVDPRDRPGHPPDWVVHLADGTIRRTCGNSREEVLAWAVFQEDEEHV